MARLLRDERGLSSVEYVALLTLICAMAVGTWNVLGQSLACKLAGASESLRAALGSDDKGGTLAQCGSGTAFATPLGSSASTQGDTDRQTRPDTPDRAPTKPANPKPNNAAVARVWSKQVKALLCPDSAALLKDLQKRGTTVTLYDRIYYEDPYFDGSSWTTKHFEGAGSAGRGDIKIIMGSGRSESAATLFHEGTHVQQPSSMSRRDKEYDAYAKEDAWRISKGLPPHDPSFRTTGPGGQPRTDLAAIKRYVDKEYPGVTATPKTGTAPDEIVDRAANGDTVLERPNGTRYTRPPQRGDSYPGPEKTVPAGGIPVDMGLLQC